jgi:hypothetical protein
MRRPLPCRATCALLAGLLACLPALQASAAKKARPTTVVVAPYAPLLGVPAALAAKAGDLVAGELKGRDELKVVEAPQAGAPAPRPDFEKLYAQATAALAQGRDLGLQGQHGAAAEALARSVGALVGRPAAIDAEGGKLLAELTEALAIERLAGNDDDGADAALAALVRLSPSRPPPTGTLPAGFLRSFRAVERRTLAQPRGALRIHAPDGGGEARVFVDGRALRAAPVLVKDVLPGDHFVRVERDGEVWADRVTVLAGLEVPLTPQLGEADQGPASELRTALQAGQLDRVAVGKAARLAKASKAEAVVLGALSRQGDGYTVRSFLYFARSEKLLQLPVMSLDAELLGGSLEVLKVADDVQRRLVKPGSPVALPVALGAPGAAGSAAAVTEVSAAPPPPNLAADPTVVAPLPDLPTAAPAQAAAAPQLAAPAVARSVEKSAEVASAKPGRAIVTPIDEVNEKQAPKATAKVAEKAPAPAPAPVQTPAPAPVAPPPAPAPKAEVAAHHELVVPRSPTGALQLAAPPPAEKKPEPAPAPAAPPPAMAAAAPAHTVTAVAPAALAVPSDERPAATEPKNRTAMWIVLGVVSATALGASGYLLWQSSRTPSTATLNASWTH